jgi:hypothetical protein
VKGGRRIRSLADFPTGTRVPAQKFPRKWPGKLFSTATKAPASFYLVVSVPPPALEVTGDLDKGESRDERSGNDLGTGLTGCDGGIDERPHEEGGFASLSPPISGKTEVKRELE